MGKVAHDRYAASKQVFEEASEAAGVDMARVCWGDLTYLQDDPRIVQPAIITVDLAEYAAWKEWNGEPDLVSGLSLGIYAAMGAAEIFQSYSDTISAVKKRAELLYELHRHSPGGMAGFVGLAKHQLDPILEKTNAKIAVMRDRVRDSVVVVGSRREIDETEIEVKKSGVRRFENLKIFGWFHHEDNASVQGPYREYLEGMDLSDPKIRILGNHAIFLNTAQEAVDHALDQFVEPADWDHTIGAMAQIGVTKVIETGPDTTRGLARQMSKRFNTQTIKFPESV
jgi:[acyl-carrier-protein] S-malonyltransferase